MIFGITMNPDADLQVLQATARQAEELGFAYCYLADQGFSRDVYVTLAALATCTKTLRLGPGVTHPYVRHPAATAVAVATLDELSHHRAFLGIGAGGTRTLGPLGIERREPLRACREAVEIARLLWTGQSVNYSGRYFHMRGARISFPCRTDIEVHWAARGPKMLHLGGRLADVVFLHGLPHSEIPEAVAHIRAGALEAQRNVKIFLALPIVFDGPSFDSGRLRTAYRLVDLSPNAVTRLGLSAQFLSRIRELVVSSQLKAAAQLVEPDLLRQFVVDATDPKSLQNLAAAISSLRLDGFVAEISNPYLAESMIAVAREVIAKTIQDLQGEIAGCSESYGEVSQ